MMPAQAAEMLQRKQLKLNLVMTDDAPSAVAA